MRELCVECVCVCCPRVVRVCWERVVYRLIVDYVWSVCWSCVCFYCGGCVRVLYLVVCGLCVGCVSFMCGVRSLCVRCSLV